MMLYLAEELLCLDLKSFVLNDNAEFAVPLVV